jgi:YQGE family putative transporter
MMSTFAIFSIVYSISNLFINIYIWKHHSSLVHVAWFQFCSFLFVFIGFMCGAIVIRFIGSRINFLLSSVTALILYAYLLTGRIDTWMDMAWAGLFNGLYIGVFYAGLNFYSIWFSERKQMSKVISMQYAISGIAQMITPLIIGWVIHAKGYSMAFSIAVGILLLQTILSTATPQVRIRKDFRKKGFFIPSNRRLGYMGISAASFGFFYAFVHMSVGVFIYMYLQDEFLLGEWNMLFAFLSVVTYYVLGRTLMQSHQEILGTLGVLMSTIITMTLFFSYPVSFVVFNAVISVFLPMMWVPAYTNQLNTIRHQAHQSRANPLTKMMELLVFREFSLCVGRLAFFTILMICVVMGQSSSLYIVLIFLCFMPTALYVLSKKAKA